VADSRLRLCWHTAAAAGSAAVERPALLLLHGIGTTHDDFTTLAHGLAAKFQVLAPDLPGHGPSTAVPVAPTVAAITEAIEAELDSLGIDRIHVLGNSLGGRLALEARRRALSIVAVAPSGMGLQAERIYQAAALAAATATLRPVRRLMAPAARFTVPRTVFLAGLRSAPWRAGQAEVIGPVDGGDFWRLLWTSSPAGNPDT
jgi:pimeloyl-ACP methyl ester carboxylesterase